MAPPQKEERAATNAAPNAAGTSVTGPNLQIPAGFETVLRDLSREVLRQQPADLTRFCADYFQGKLDERAGLKAASGAGAAKKSGGAAADTAANPSAPSHVTTAKATGSRSSKQQQAQQQQEEEAATAAGAHHHGTEDEGSGEDEAVAMPPPQPPSSHNRNRRQSVSAESMQPQAKYDKKVVPKNEEQRSRIKDAIQNNFLFRSLDEDQYKEVVDAMEEKKVPTGTEVIAQGAVGDNFYVVESGTLDVFVERNGKRAKVTDYDHGASFGELALMYNAPRAATVVTTSPCTLWALDRVTFRQILLENTAMKRKTYEGFLEEVDLLKGLESYERHKIADALESRTYNDGEVVIRQNDEGDSFYIIEQGSASIEKIENGNVRHFPDLHRGQYFGELALLNDDKRQATVTAKGKLKVVTLNKKAFDRLLGPVADILKRNEAHYTKPATPA